MTSRNQAKVCVGIVLFWMIGIIVGFSCRSPEAPAEVVPVVEQELTVIPHPKFGFDLVIIPEGTVIDGFVTMEPGLYLAGDGLRHVLREMGLGSEQWMKGATD